MLRRLFSTLNTSPGRVHSIAHVESPAKVDHLMGIDFLESYFLLQRITMSWGHCFTKKADKM